MPPAAVTLPKQRRRSRATPAASGPASSHRGAQADDRGHRADHARRTPCARAEGAAPDEREQDQRDLPRRRIEHVLFHGRALGIERASVRGGDSGQGRHRVGVPRLRGGTRARAGVEERRSARVAGRREPLPADRRHPQGSRRRHRPRRRRRAAALLRLQRREERKRRHRVRRRRRRSRPVAACSKAPRSWR